MDLASIDRMITYTYASILLGSQDDRIGDEGKFRRMFCNMVHDGFEDFLHVRCEVKIKAIVDFL